MVMAMMLMLFGFVRFFRITIFGHRTTPLYNTSIKVWHILAALNNSL